LSRRPAQDAQCVISRADDAQIRIEHITFSYPDSPPALRDVSLTVAAGEFVGLLGPNGSGKTTLAKHLNGLLKPHTGRVLVNGRDTRPLRVAELARTVGYVFQDPDHQIFSPTVSEEVAFGLKLQGLSTAEVAERITDGLATFGLAPVADLPPALLGWGQRRQVALASVLATRPEILVLDEPTGGLDARNRDTLRAALAEAQRLGATVILITHNVRLVAECASRAVVLSQGGIVFDGTPAQLFEQRTTLSAAKLAVPPVVRLAQRLRSAGLAPGVLSCADFVAAWQGRCGSAGSSNER
jgi:energy-coupling factor transport system ATP-binding protein